MCIRDSAYSVYSELAKQMEQAKIAVNETTPLPVSYTHLDV